MSSGYLTIEQAADLLGCAPDTMRSWARHGKVPALKLGKEWRFVAAQLTAYIENKAAENIRSCRSIDAPEARIGGSASQSAAAAFANLPAPRIRRRPSSTRPTLAIVHGGKRD